MRGDDQWEVEVIDNGPGVPSEVVGRAFESFVTTKEAGTGLGLAIVKRIVDLHGGATNLISLPDGRHTRVVLDSDGDLVEQWGLVPPFFDSVLDFSLADAEDLGCACGRAIDCIQRP